MTAHGSPQGSAHGTPATARSVRPAPAGWAAHVTRAFAHALRRAVGPATIGLPSNGAAPVFHPPGVIRVVTPAELGAAGAAGRRAKSP